MNTAALNTFELNGDVLDAVQRSVVSASVVAQVLIGAHVWKRADISGGGVPAEARITQTMRARVRGGASIQPSASFGFYPRSYSTAPVAIRPEAAAAFGGTAYSRSYVANPMTWSSQASILPSPRIRARLLEVISVEASVGASPRSFTRVRSSTVIDASVDVWTSVGTLRRIPYLEDAVDERSIPVPLTDRTLIVS